MSAAADQLVRTTYPLRALVASPKNVRSKVRTPADILGMAMNINAHGGLLQNLVVVPEVKDGQRTGRAAVAAGETRRLALWLLADGELPDAEGFDVDYPVPVIEVADEEAVAASASENILRTTMHPADQFQAFSTLYDQCGSIEQVAAMFNVTPLTVQRRLKLAAASPKLFELYRNDGMTLEQLMALCITDDHAAQEQAWNATKGRAWEQEPHRLRAMLTAEEVPSSAPIARFVTVKAYEQAGGIVRRDLFSDDDGGTLVARALLRTLAEQKLEQHAAKLRTEGWAWTEVRAQATNNYDLSGYGRAQQGMRTLTEDERARLQALQAEYDQADKDRDALYDQEEDEEVDRAKARELHDAAERLRTQLAKLRESFAAWTPEVLAHAGAVVTFDQSGRLAVFRGLIRPQDRKAAAKATTQAQAAASQAGDSGQPVPADKPVEDNKAGLSESLIRRLTAHRTVALRRMLADNTQVALAALAHVLVQRVLDDAVSYRVNSALDLQAKGCENQLDAATESSANASRAWAELQDLRHQWGERIPGDQDKRLPWLIALPVSELCDLIALCVALTVNAVQPTAVKHSSDALAHAMGLDMADWWEPTAGEYLALVPKALIGKALAEADMPADAVAIEKLKKGEAVARAETLLQGKRWLPVPLRKR